MKLEQANAGTASNELAIRDTQGTGVLPIQIDVESGTPTWFIDARVSPEAPWMQISTGAADVLESISWIPYVQLRVTGTGTVALYIAEK